MANSVAENTRQEARLLRRELLDADDHKIRRILAITDNVSDPAVNRTLLDPLRQRLALLQPVRPLRFNRLLFTPLDPLIVPGREWKPGEPTLPRTALTIIAKAVRLGLGGECGFIDNIIAGFNDDASLAFTVGGEMLWPRAAEILAGAPLPADWEETGLRPETWPNLAKAIAVVLSRATQLRRLARDADAGSLEVDGTTVNEILRCGEEDPPEAYAMVVRLIMVQAPHAIPLLRQIAALGRNAAEKIAMRLAIEHAMDRVVNEMDESVEFANEIGGVGLVDATAGARRMATLLREVEVDTNAVIQRSRLTTIREKLDAACRSRFAHGVKEGLVAPLSQALEPLDAACQAGLETCARDLRRLEIVARQLSGPASYDQELQRASEVVRVAAESGMLTPMRQLRLIEILLGPEAAEIMYWRDKDPVD